MDQREEGELLSDVKKIVKDVGEIKLSHADMWTRINANARSISFIKGIGIAFQVVWAGLIGLIGLILGNK